MNSFKQIAYLGALVVLLIVVLSLSGNLVENVDANEVLIVQSPTGKISVYTSAGIKPQWFGKVTHIAKREQFSFSSSKDQGKVADESLTVQFAEGGTAKVSGVISWEMPSDEKSINTLYSLYGDQRSIEQQLIRPAVERSLYLTGTLMTSTEAFSARKAEFLRYFEDQVKNGIYETQAIDTKTIDPLSGAEKTVKIVQIVQRGGLAARASESPLKQFNIGILPPAIDAINWDNIVKSQIAEQQKAITQVQTAQAQAKEAEQKAITVQKQGEAEAAKAKWEQEVLKATAVTAAEQQLAVNKLNALAAEQYKREQVLIGEGDAERKRLTMQADGALQQKLATYERVQATWAEAFKGHNGPLVPNVVMGGSTTNASSSVQTIMDAIGVKAMRDLSLDLSVPTGRK